MKVSHEPNSCHILTGEYPPRPGGVSDHSFQVAQGLASAGISVHVWTSETGEPRNGGARFREGEAPAEPTTRQTHQEVRPPGIMQADLDLEGVFVHRLNDPWSAAGLAEIDRSLDGFPARNRLLVQYTPNAWGRKGLNFGFVRWLNSRVRRGDDVRPIVHEPWFRTEPWDRPWRYVLPPLQRRMARELFSSSRLEVRGREREGDAPAEPPSEFGSAGASPSRIHSTVSERKITTVYVTIPHWERLLRPYARSACFVNLPVPSNVPFVDDPEAVAEIRRRVTGDSSLVIGTFGTYREEIAPRLLEILPRVLNRADRVGLLIGRNGQAFAKTLPARASRVVATGGLPPREVSLHLQACDVLIQPYRDGVTARRGTLMAGLCQGKAIVTTSGKMSEPIWQVSGCVALAEDGDTPVFVSRVEELLANPGLRRSLGEVARGIYVREFALERTMEILLRD